MKKFQNYQNNIIVDCSYLLAKNTGLERYTKNFLNSLNENFSQNSNITLFVKKKFFRKDSLNFDGLNKRFFFQRSYSFSFFCIRNLLINSFFHIKTKIISLHFDYPFWLPISGLCVIHDITPIIYDHYFSKYKSLKNFYFKNYIKFILKKKNLKLITISKFNIQKLKENYKFNYKDIKLIYSGLDVNFYKNVKLEIKKKSPFDFDYILYVGDRRSHKNLKRMVEIFLILKKNFSYKGKFLILGNKKKYNFDLPLNKDIIEIGEVNDNDLASYYYFSDALFFISLFEGFGLPVIESLFFNTKVILNKDSACSEIANDYCLKLNLSNNNYNLALKISDFLKSNHFKNDFDIQNFDFSLAVKNILDHLLDLDNNT